MTRQEEGQFLLLFNREGYVLNFTTEEIDTFTLAKVGVAICSKYKMSKGKSLNAYLNDAPEEDRQKLIADLFAYYEKEYITEYSKETYEKAAKDPMNCSPAFNEQYSQRYENCKRIMNTYTNIRTPLQPIAKDLIDCFDSTYMKRQINLMLEMTEVNPTEAIGKAKELIESCCKTVLEKKSIACDKTWDVQRLATETMKTLKLMPRDIPNNAREAENMKALLNNLLQITSRMAELRNPYGSGHGKSASYRGLEPRHAQLAVGASITLVKFIWDTYEQRGTI